ncbi:MAG: hypothetical protein ACYTKC_16015 [Planctomycetota bacterium]|jgi:hypothetical protein
MSRSPVGILVVLAGFLAVPSHCLAQATPEAEKVAEAEGRKVLAEIRETQSEMATIRARLMGPVKVNDKVIPADQVRREAVFLVGVTQLELKILEFIVAEWQKNGIEENGRKPEEFKLDEKKIEADIKQSLDKFRALYPNLDFWEVVRAQTGLSKRQHIQNSRVTQLFNKVFFPGAPDQWPEITAEAIKAGSKGGQAEGFWESMVKNGRNPDGTPREMPAMWMEMIRRMLIQQLKSWSDIKYPSHGIAPDIVVDVNGMQWKTEDAFDEVKEAMFLQEMEKAYSEVVIREALKQELQKHGAYLSDERFTKLYNEYSKEYEGTLFNLDMIARAFKGYPTLEAFRQRWRLMRSFEDLIAKEINDDNLQKYADRHKRFFADGSVNVDVIPFMAKDSYTGGWKDNGLAEAKKRADMAMAAIKAGKTFDAVLEEMGEFYINDKDRGRFGSKSLNDLRRTLRESEYSELLDGASLGYYIYYDAEVGKVEGPLRCSDAYYLVRVNSRGPASNDVKVSDERTRELVKQDYTSYRFLEWANEVLARTKIEPMK